MTTNEDEFFLRPAPHRSGQKHQSTCATQETLSTAKRKSAKRAGEYGYIFETEAAHENEPRLAVPSCHGRRRPLNTQTEN